MKKLKNTESAQLCDNDYLTPCGQLTEAPGSSCFGFAQTQTPQEGYLKRKSGVFGLVILGSLPVLKVYRRIMWAQ